MLFRSRLQRLDDDAVGVDECMNILFSPPDITQAEIDEVIDALKSGWITTGPKTKMLENSLSQFTNTKKTVALNSATAALEMCLRLLGVKEGDEVITENFFQ